ncbi:hypothetical protein BaRGS_00005920 [Batillaria attramentaria]|uniref:Uncharacterized protein n=1 Tax=Batillaria attramentaria TaxID=370345 RepID=A0ABD0LSV3_9CAEN
MTATAKNMAYSSCQSRGHQAKQICKSDIIGGSTEKSPIRGQQSFIALTAEWLARSLSSPCGFNIVDQEKVWVSGQLPRTVLIILETEKTEVNKLTLFDFSHGFH